MDEWKKLIRRGNRCFEHDRLEKAWAWYEAALQEADCCVADCAMQGSRCRYLDALAAIAALVVTQHNLADLCVRGDRMEDAAAHLRAAHAKLMHLIDDINIPWAVRAAALRNSSQTRLAMLSFADEHGTPDTTFSNEQRICHRPLNPVLH